MGAPVDPSTEPTSAGLKPHCNSPSAKMQPNDTPTAHVLQNGSAKCIQFTIHMGINLPIPHDLNLLQLQILRHAPNHMCPDT